MTESAENELLEPGNTELPPVPETLNIEPENAITDDEPVQTFYKFGEDGYWAASSVTSSTVNIIGVYPIYGTTVNTTTLTKQTLCQKPATNANVTFAMKGDNGPGGTRWSFAIPSTWSVKVCVMLLKR